MEQTSQEQTNHPSSPAIGTDKFINLRPYLGLRLGLFAVALLVALLYVGTMAFGNGSMKTSEPTDPAVAQAAWQDLVSDTLTTKGPTEPAVSLPATESPSIGLVPVRLAGN